MRLRPAGPPKHDLIPEGDGISLLDTPRSVVPESGSRSAMLPLLLPPSRFDAVDVERRRLRETRCVIYARYSKTTDSPDSIERQVSLAQEYAESIGLTVVWVYEEPRKSGTTVSKRMVLQGMLAELDELNIGHVIVESQDRLGRKMVVLAELWKQIHERGVPIHSARDRAPIPIVRWCISAGFIEEERGRIVERLASGIRRSASEGTPHMAGCFGYTRAMVDGQVTFVVDPAEAETVRFVFSRFNAGWSPAMIAEYLNSEVPGGRHGRTWTADFIRGSKTVMSGMLRHFRYTGYQTHGVTKTVEIDGRRRNVLRPSDEWTISPLIASLQIVSVEQFNAAQERLQGLPEKTVKPKGYSKRFLRPLQGLLRCAHCGGGMSAKADRSGNRQERYTCNVARNRSAPGAKHCDMSGGLLRYRLEDAFSELIGDELVSLEKTGAFVDAFNAALTAAPQKAQAERKLIEQQLAEISAKVLKTWDDAFNEGMTPQWMADLRARLESQETILRERLAAMRVPARAPLVLAPLKSATMLDAMSAMMAIDRIDCSQKEGAELVGSLRELIRAVVLDLTDDGSFTMRIEVRPHAMLDSGNPAEREVVVLERTFGKAPRGYFGSPRFASAMAAKAAEGRHCLPDAAWAEISHLVPPRVAVSCRIRAGGAVLDARTVVEAALFHLQTGAPLRHLPEAFGPPAEVFNALRRLQTSGSWAAVEPVLRRTAPALFEGVTGTKTFPLYNPDVPQGRDLRSLGPEEKAAAGLHRLSDREWAIAAPLVSAEVMRTGDRAERLDPRRLLDGVMFMLREGIPYSQVPLHFGPRDRFQRVTRRLVAHHCWDRIVAAFRERSPSSLVGLDLERFDNHARSRNEKPVSRIQHDRNEIIAKLLRVEELFDRGSTYKEAARLVDISETQLHRWRADHRFRHLTVSRVQTAYNEEKSR
jgi:site-specific DNA recombinase